ncbi:MAG: hypothetical protein M1817_000081 [Caeruleum heppii]|nr:MAG: hypothetical protein M1817_000081 [Caeruleum heppii]
MPMAASKTAPTKTHRQQGRTSPQRANSIVTPKQVSGTRKGLRSQDKTPVSHVPPSQPVRSSPIRYVIISQTARAKRKRSQDSEAQAERPAKQARRSGPSRLEPFEEDLERDSEAEAKADDPEPPPLSGEFEEDIRTIYKEVMNSAANNASALKRTSSRHSIVPSETDTGRSHCSSNTTAHYRYKHLEDANLYVHIDPPEEVQAAIDDIINAEPSEDCYAVLRDKAKKFSKRCKEMVRAAAGEDDFVHLFYNVIEDISSDNLISREKADWRVELKPTIRQSDANLSFLSDFNAMGSDEQEEVDDASVLPPPKRHQQSAGCLYISPRNSQIPLSDSQPDNGLPQPHKAKDPSPIKTPRPDITTGIKESAVISALASSLSSPDFNYTRTKAKQFLEKLQDATIPNGRDGPPGRVLIIVPTQRESNLTFPTLVFEGKGYSTGKQIFEAQNQAAVSGAGGVKIQMMLNELVKRATKSSDVPLTPWKNRPPLVFAICSEGPQHELWAHYTVIEDGEHQFNMALLNTCHGIMPKQVEGFFVQVDNVLNWTAGPFLKSVVDGLGKVVMKSRYSAASRAETDQ